MPIIDVSNPAVPVSLAILDFRQIREDEGTGIAVDDKYIYLTTDRAIVDDGVNGDTRLSIGQYFLEDDEAIPPEIFERVVDGRANVFGAGHATPPGGGLTPPGVTFSVQPGSVLTVSSITGTVSGFASGCVFNGPDGGQVCGSSTNVLSTQGISGIQHTNRTMFLTGVFLSGAEPTDPAPTGLTFSSTQDFDDLSPELDQTFFLGDGRGLTGQVQRFHVPAGATRLFLGFSETLQFSSPGLPGFYTDNGGSLTATFQVSPP